MSNNYIRYKSSRYFTNFTEIYGKQFNTYKYKSCMFSHLVPLYKK